MTGGLVSWCSRIWLMDAKNEVRHRAIPEALNQREEAHDNPSVLCPVLTSLSTHRDRWHACVVTGGILEAALQEMI